MKKFLVLLALGMMSQLTHAAVIDFEDLSAVGHFGSISHDRYESQGLLFDSAGNYAAYANSSGGGGGSWSVNSIVGNANYQGISGSLVDAASSFSVSMGDWCCDFDTGTLSVFDADGNLLGTDSGSGNSWFNVSVAANMIKSFSISATGMVLYDSISFETTDVPEPSPFLLMATGLAGLGFASRKKKQA